MANYKSRKRLYFDFLFNSVMLILNIFFVENKTIYQSKKLVVVTWESFFLISIVDRMSCVRTGFLEDNNYWN